MNDKEITTIIGLCSQWWTNWHAPESLPTMVIAWRQQLGDVPFDAGLAALSEHSANGSEFPPPVGVIRRRAAQLTMPAGRAPAPDEAWGEVKSEISRVGYTSDIAIKVGGAALDDRTVKFSHPAISSVVGAMGWVELCRSENDVADRAHFVRLYAERVERQIGDRALPPAVLEIQAAAAAAIEAGEPARVGDLVHLLPRASSD